MDNKKSSAGLVVGTAALITSAIALARGKVAAASEKEVSLDKETMELLIAIAAAAGSLDNSTLESLDKLDALRAAIEAISIPGGPGGQGWPANCDNIRATRVIFPVANRALQLPDTEIPDGFALVLKGDPGNANIIYIGDSAATCTNVNQSWPLLPSEIVGYYLKNSKALWASAAAAGDFLCVTVEQRKGGG